MKKLTTLLAATAVIASPMAVAAEASKEENIGVGAGGVIGAIAGGPVGFIVGAAIGARIGDHVHDKNETIDELGVALDQSQQDTALLRADMRTVNNQLDSLAADLRLAREHRKTELAGLMEAGIAMDLLFRTDESVLADTTGARLAELATRIAAMPDIRVQLDGFADERGDETYNKGLSERRVEFVRDQLLAAGVAPERILTAAHGESVAQDSSSDSLALERRVALKLFIDTTPSVAANP